VARKYDDPASSEATREATVVVFESFRTYLGVAIGECLGYLFTGAWTVLVAVANQASWHAPYELEVRDSLLGNAWATSATNRTLRPRLTMRRQSTRCIP
jgi:hypothetical protein